MNWRPLNGIKAGHRPQGYLRLYSYMLKSLIAGFGCGIGSTPALSVTTAPMRRHLWRKICTPYLYIYVYIYLCYRSTCYGRCLR